ncbi:MAG TPA: GNAT family N-acetyltransferase [Galbitalea sp.]|jgi:ribosomal protein S18 acetylase RimI-like enzyme|nr:GNAT family N-acetyltransferase [Galbitalea sp.]
MTTIRNLEQKDRAVWQDLYAGYGEFYKTPLGAEKADRVWAWLMDPDYEAFGLVAVDDTDKPIALAHYRQFARLLADGIGIYLDDLFTSPDARGGGAGTALIDRVEEIARERGAGVVRWITANDNFVGQKLYDRMASRTMWVTYDLVVK